MSQCLKCGKKAEEQAVFCSECLAVMDQYPVKPGTVVHLPLRQPRQDIKATSDFDEHAYTEQLAHNRGLIRGLTAVIAGLSVLLVITAVLLMHTLEQQQSVSVIGRNYTTSTSAQKP